MENKNQRCYYVEYTDFEEFAILGHGIESFVYDHRDSASPRDWLGKMFDVCMDHDHAIVYICDVDGFDNCVVAPVFLYSDDRGFMLHVLDKFCVPVVDPSFEAYDCFIDSYEAFVHAAFHSVVTPDGDIYMSDLDSKFVKKVGEK